MAATLLLPPIGFLVLGLIGLLLRPSSRSVARAAVACSILGLLLTALPATPKILMGRLETGFAAAVPETIPAGDARIGAIVLLGGDQARLAVSDKPFDVGPLTLDRERTAVGLARRTGLPVLVTGGSLSDGAPSIADLMAHSLAVDFAIRVKWIEPKARTTWENAALSAAMLRHDGIGAAFVVTQSWHMRRALLAFRHAGFPVLPIAVPSHFTGALEISDLIPRPSAWVDSGNAIHEWVGLAYYALRS